MVDGKVTLGMCLARAATLTDIGAWPREIEKCSRTVLQTGLLVLIFYLVSSPLQNPLYDLLFVFNSL